MNQDGGLFTQSFLQLTSSLLGVPLSEIASGYRKIVTGTVFANEPAERRRSAGEAAENSAARRMPYAKNSRSSSKSVSVRCKM